MDFRRFLGNTALYHAPDGRVVFRPWGSRGRTYLVDSRAEKRLTNFLGVWYGIALVAVVVIAPRFGITALLATFAAITGGLYLGYWLFSKTLPETEAPPRPSPDYREQLLRENSEALGRPFLIVLIVIATLMALSGLLVLALGDVVTGAFAFVFFGAGAGLFVWQLRKL